jgi:ornithine cyclodeaminase/alanine dehydrogenase-like protein (mu-crystallin family)
MVLVLSKQDVAALVAMPALVKAVEAALIEVSAGTAINPNRLRVFVPEHQAMMACMPAYLGQANVLGAKIVSSSSRKPAPGAPRPMSALTVLADTDGSFLSIMCGTHLGALRTAAASGVAIRHLAAKDASSMAIIGCGVQGRAELEGAVAVRHLSRVFVYDTDAAKAEDFRARMTERHGVPIRVETSADAAVAQADIVALATTSTIPVVASAAFRPGVHINAVGAHTPKTRELDSDTVASARLFVESRPAILAEAGDVIIPIEEGRIEPAHIIGELGEVAAGTRAGRAQPDDITIFKSTGIAVEDVVAARLIYEAAIARGFGTAIDM